MKKILLLIISLLVTNIYPHFSLAADFDLADDETDEDLIDIFGNSGDEFDIFESDEEAANGSVYMIGNPLD